MKLAIKLLDLVHDSISGFEGIVTGRAEYAYGCVQIAVAPKAMHDGQPGESRWFDEGRLVEGAATKATGGPQDAPPAPGIPPRLKPGMNGVF